MHKDYLSSIHNIAQVCAQKGIKYAVLSPGSRCAPLTIAFARHPEIETFVIPDERSAAFVALGIAIESQEPTVLICTSGTASLNYYPAIAEAFYQHVPLLVLTADRPTHLIDTGDGQCIRQKDVYVNHIKKSYQFDKELLDDNHELIQEGIDFTNQVPKGPVHFNIPIDEPFYPEAGEEIQFRNIELLATSSTNQELPLPQLNSNKTLIVAGQENYSAEIKKKLGALNVPVICDSISNLHDLPNAITTHDLIIGNLSDEEKVLLQPELLISLGNAVLSKALKLYLRNYHPTKHINFSNNAISGDVFQSIDQKFEFELFNKIDGTNLKNDAIDRWFKYQEDAVKHSDRLLSESSWNEFRILYRVVKSLPEKCNIHVSNSMSIRYINHLSYLLKAEQTIYCNRGTSGIDGSNSTAVGIAIASPETPNVLISGDLSFFYDRNAFWHKHRPDNLAVVLMNNGGGGIFRMIDGPARQPEHYEYFETPQTLTAENTAKDFGFSYRGFSSSDDIPEKINSNEIQEYFTSTVENTAFYKRFKSMKG